FFWCGSHRTLHSFPTRRSSDLAGPINVANNGSTSIVNPAVADDNSPLPRDRIGFRFNFYDNAQQVTGFGEPVAVPGSALTAFAQDRKSTRLNSSHLVSSYAVFC